MQLVVARTTNPSIASFAFTNLSAVFDCYVTWLDPLAAASSWTVDLVACCIFLKLPVPRFLEVLVEKLVYVLERYVFSRTTPWRHMRWISNGHCENTPQAFMAHAVRASELCGSRDQDVVGTASET